MKTVKCCICGKEFKVGKYYWGNNPEPVKSMNEGVCCDECNINVVVPTRVANAKAFRMEATSSWVEQKVKEIK